MKPSSMLSYSLVTSIPIALIVIALVWFQLKTPDTEVYQTTQSTEISEDTLVIVSSPEPGASVGEELIVSGYARGQYFFEGAFPVWLQTPAGEVVARSPARAVGEWMTTDMVPFQATFQLSGSPRDLVLVLKRDNPSGLPENDHQVEVPVLFNPAIAVERVCKNKGCGVCAGQNAPIPSCLESSQLTCYNDADCKLDTGGKCGWVVTDELLACLSDS